MARSGSFALCIVERHAR
jgi:hypothetical protein